MVCDDLIEEFVWDDAVGLNDCIFYHVCDGDDVSVLGDEYGMRGGDGCFIFKRPTVTDVVGLFGGHDNLREVGENSLGWDDVGFGGFIELS